MTARISVLLKSRASLTCFRACFLPGRAKDLSASWLPALKLRILSIGKVCLCRLTLQRGVMGTARMLHALTHLSKSRQVREQM